MCVCVCVCFCPVFFGRLCLSPEFYALRPQRAKLALLSFCSAAKHKSAGVAQEGVKLILHVKYKILDVKIHSVVSCRGLGRRVRMYKSTREGGTIGLDRKVCMKLETEGREEERERDQGVIRTPKHVSCSLAPLVGSRHTKKLYRLFSTFDFSKNSRRAAGRHAAFFPRGRGGSLSALL